MWKNFKPSIRYYLYGKYHVVAYEEIPLKLNKFTIYLIEDWSILLKCPCGCTNLVHLNTLKEVIPSWSFIINKNKISISPSGQKKQRMQESFLD